MISVLIPIYNYNTYALVKEIHQQCLQANIVFEICCFDDASTRNILENRQISTLSFCRIKYLPKNIGRSKIRNNLVQESKYDWLIFLDADVFPSTPDLIQHYLSVIAKNDIDVAYGGLMYAEKPASEYALRWLYGKKREAIGVKKRRKKKYESLLFSNTLLRKNSFLKVRFHEDISNYGYEDLVLGLQLKMMKMRVKHLQNPVYHLHIEHSEIFMEKTIKALYNLKFLIEHNILKEKSTKLTKTYGYVKKMKTEGILRFLFLKTERLLKRNLLSGHPSLFIFDLYKLGYFCMINAEK